MSIAPKDLGPLTQGSATRFGLTDEAHRLLLDDVLRGLADTAAGRTEDADTAIARLRQQQVYRPPR